jgi:hypothetical protein
MTEGLCGKFLTLLTEPSHVYLVVHKRADVPCEIQISDSHEVTDTYAVIDLLPLVMPLLYSVSGTYLPRSPVHVVPACTRLWTDSIST